MIISDPDMAFKTGPKEALFIFIGSWSEKSM